MSEKRLPHAETSTIRIIFGFKSSKKLKRAFLFTNAMTNTDLQCKVNIQCIIFYMYLPGEGFQEVLEGCQRL